MKKFLSLAVLLIVLVSCGGPEKVGSGTVSSKMDFWVLQIDLCEHMYEPQIGMLENNLIFLPDLMMETFEEGLQKVKDSDGCDDPDEYEPNGLAELKELTIGIIETYISVAENEIAQLDDENVRGGSDKWNAIMKVADKKIANAYDAFSECQEKLAAKYGITLW
ncbi:MAG: hypothetical protein QNK23_02700 [Crocinitomicaceae bacterium]|nr:hypothetical protein [Crocinitomicaceae bacterium]